jgi:transposase
MPKAYSGDLRERVIATVRDGASRREAAERFEISASSAVRWLQCWQETGRAAPKPRGGSISRLERHAAQILALVAEQPDLTLEEVRAVLHKRRIPSSLGALWRFFDRHDITVKKKPEGGRAAPGRRGSGASALDPRARHA